MRVWFNPMNKKIGKAEVRNLNDDHAEVYLKVGQRRNDDLAMVSNRTKCRRL